MPRHKNIPLASRTLDARPDTVDFRDRMYVPTLVEVPTHIPMEGYLAHGVPILDQGTEGACTGFALATVAHYLLRRRRVHPDPTPVSARMLYELARRYDEWPGEEYDGSSARGAMKGWHKHGVCAEAIWPYRLRRSDDRGLTDARTGDALLRPLGAYFRVNHRDLVAMHAAIAEVGILYATCTVHDGWNAVGQDGIVTQSDALTGGHAFAIVAYDADGFWIQNSWGPGWGRKGFAHLSYDDWMANGSDVWVARLGAPVRLMQPRGIAATQAGAASGAASTAFADLRPHVVNVGNNGHLKPRGNYGMTETELAQVFRDDIQPTLAKWPKKRLLLYAHGGLVDETSAIQRLAEYRPALLASGVYPLAFIWHTGYWTTITNILQDAVRRRRPEGFLDATKDFMLDRLDDALEPLARSLTGKAVWDEMKENALAASKRGRAAHLVAQHVAELLQAMPGLEIHLAAHSAGSILHAPLIRLLTDKDAGLGLKIKTCTLWAPACTTKLFKSDYLPAIQSGAIDRFALFVLDDKAEQDDHCARIYNKSLLYLVSNAFEDKPRIPLWREGEPLLGLQHCIQGDPVLRKLFADGRADLVIAPNNDPAGSITASRAHAHGDFDDDGRTVEATFMRIIGTGSAAVSSEPSKAGQTAREATLVPAAAELNFARSEASLRSQRRGLERQS